MDRGKRARRRAGGPPGPGPGPGPGQPTPRRRQALATRAAIVDAAQDLFLRRGYTAATIEAIAAGAGVAASTVYFVFGSKRGLLRAIRERWHEQSQIKSVLAEASERESASERLEMLARGTRRQWEAGPAMIAIYRGAAAADPQAAEELRAALAGRRASLDRFVEAMAGTLRPGLATADAAAVTRALCRAEVYEELVAISGWTADRYESWLAAALKAQLLGGTRTRG